MLLVVLGYRLCDSSGGGTLVGAVERSPCPPIGGLPKARAKRSGRFDALVSTVVLDELLGAPEHVRRLYAELGPRVEVAELSESALELVRHYVAAGIVGKRWRADAQHVAMASVCGCRAIVSWNFRHIVHFEKIPLYNGVNMSRGFGPLAIQTPQEMIRYEDENQDI